MSQTEFISIFFITFFFSQSSFLSKTNETQYYNLSGCLKVPIHVMLARPASFLDSGRAHSLLARMTEKVYLGFLKQILSFIMTKGRLIFKDGSEFEGISFGSEIAVAGEVVFSTGMVGYPESFTDPSYSGQILVLTYPIVGNYGVPDKKFWESDKIHVKGLIVSQYIDTPFHYHSVMTLGEWFRSSKIPILQIKDTRFLTQKIREQGSMLGKIVFDKDIAFDDPNLRNLVEEVSVKEVSIRGDGKKTIVLFDCGDKYNISRNFLKRGAKLITVPWNFDIFNSDYKFDALFFSNGPGDPKKVGFTTSVIKKALENKIPTLGICLGHQMLALAAGGDTYKLKFGHRGQNQPCYHVGTNRCYLTTQNHGYAVSVVPEGFKTWFTNANDNTNEGIIHERLPIMSVQFHPEVNPGPMDTDWIFDFFLEKIKKH